MTTNTSPAVIASMFKHLTQSYTADEAREILVQKYPEQEGDIHSLEVRVVTADDVVDAIETEIGKLSVAVKAKTAKPAKAAKVAKVAKAKAVKAPKVAKVKKVTKMDQARALFAKATDKSRGAMITVFNTELGLSKAAASTYFYTVKG